MKKLVFTAIIIVTQCALAATKQDSCALPAGLSEEISRKYPGTSPTRLSDLDQYNRALFRADHGYQCPGLISVNFYGNEASTWALALITRDQSKRNAKLVIARKVGTAWEIKTLDAAEAATPVIWREAPGMYTDVYGEKTVRAIHPAIVFAEYESWAILYVWTGDHVEKIWISD